MLGQTDFFGESDPTAGFWTPETDPAVDAQGSDVWSALSGSASTFLSQYQDWTGGNGSVDLDRLAGEAQTARIALGQERQRRQTQGDAEGAQALADAIAEADATLALIRSAQEQASQYGTTWSTVAQYVSAMGGWFGLGVLPLIPLGLTAAAAVAAVAALAYVVTTWHTAQAKVTLITDLANRVAGGQLTTAQVQALTEGIKEPASVGFFSGLGTAGLVAAGLVAFLVLRR